MYKVLYVRAAAEKGNTVNFGSDKVCELKCDQEHERASVASDGERSSDLWHQRLGHVGEQQLKEFGSDKVCELKCDQEHEVASDGERSSDLWHQRLGHVGEQQLKELAH